MDGYGTQRLDQTYRLVVPGLGIHLFSIKQDPHNGFVPIFGTENPRLEANDFDLPRK